MSTSTSTRTFTEREGNTLKTVKETTIKYPDGRVETKREEKVETVDGSQPRSTMGGSDDMMKRFNDMKLKMEDGGSKSSGGAPVSSSGGAGGAGGEVSLKDFRAQSLKAHNERRAKHGVPPLTLNSELNDYAQKWAEHLAKSGNFAHSDCKLNGGQLGENIANKWSSGGADYTGDEAVQQWYSEISKHDYTKEQCRGTGHFTQVVWKESKELGMGKAKDSKGACFVVGSYRPAGNLIGSITKNVFPPK